MCKGLTAWHDFGSNEPSPSRRFVLPSACDISQYTAATTNSCGLKICPHCLHHRWSSFSLPAFVWPPMHFYGGTERVLLAYVSMCVCGSEELLGQQLLMLLSCLAFSQLWKHISTQECENHSRNIFHVTEKTHTFTSQFRYRFCTKCSSLFFATQHPMEMAPDISSLSGKPTRRHPPGIPSQFCKESICHPQSPLAHPPPPFVWQSGCKMEDCQAANWLSLCYSLQTRVIQWSDRDWDDRMSWIIISKITFIVDSQHISLSFHMCILKIYRSKRHSSLGDYCCGTLASRSSSRRRSELMMSKRSCWRWHENETNSSTTCH